MSFLTQQIGPLPGGAWLAVVGGGVGVSFLGRRKRTAAAAVPVPATTAQDASSYGAVQYGPPPQTGVTSMGTPKFATNEEWASAAVGYLISRGGLGSRVTNAISHVLYPDSSHPTSAEDSAIYNSAVAGVGAPPSLPAQAFIPDPPAVGTAVPGTPTSTPTTTPPGYWAPDFDGILRPKAPGAADLSGASSADLAARVAAVNAGNATVSAGLGKTLANLTRAFGPYNG